MPVPKSRSRCGRGERCRGEHSPGADVVGVSPVPVQMWLGEPSPGADVAGISSEARLRSRRLLLLLYPAKEELRDVSLRRMAKSRGRCGGDEPGLGAYAAWVISLPVHAAWVIPVPVHAAWVILVRWRRGRGDDCLPKICASGLNERVLAIVAETMYCLWGAEDS
jgi:hypothetical protein